MNEKPTLEKGILQLYMIAQRTTVALFLYVIVAFALGVSTAFAQCVVQSAIQPDDRVVGTLSADDCMLQQFFLFGFVDLYGITLPSNGRLTVRMDSTQLDSLLILLDTDLSPPPIAADDHSGGNGNALMSVSLSAGTYVIAATSFARETGTYTLSTSFLEGVDLSGTIKTVGGTDICAMVLASGQFMFSCNPPGVFSLTDLPRESDDTVKRQIYADGFFPKIDTLPDSTNEDVVMTRSGVCPNYNLPYEPAFVPGSAGELIHIAGQVLLQNSETPICAMVLANGQYMFSCDGTGSYALRIPLDDNGQFKLQVYADGFAPSIRTLDEFQTTNIVRMARAVECQ